MSDGVTKMTYTVMGFQDFGQGGAGEKYVCFVRDAVDAQHAMDTCEWHIAGWSTLATCATRVEGLVADNFLEIQALTEYEHGRIG
jgi:hypothetical protein